MGKQALPGKRKDAIYMDPDDCIVVGLDTKDGDEHVLYDERILDPIDEAMVRNIEAFGVFETILIRKDGDACQVVDGRKRVIHAREANRRRRAKGQPTIRVPAMNWRGKDLEAMGAMISTNEIRHDDTPLVRARKAQKMLNFGETEERCALFFGVEVPTIKSWLRLLDCDDKVLQAVEDGDLTSSAAMPLAQLPRAEQVEELSKMQESGKPTAKEARARATARKKARKAPPIMPNAPGAPSAPPSPRPDPEFYIAPGKRTMKKILRAVESGEADLSPDVVKTLKWVCGLTGPGSIKGLTAALREIEG